MRGEKAGVMRCYIARSSQYAHERLSLAGGFEGDVPAWILVRGGEGAEHAMHVESESTPHAALRAEAEMRKVKTVRNVKRQAQLLKSSFSILQACALDLGRDPRSAATSS